METGAASELTARSPPTLQTRYWDSKVLLTPLASRSAKPPFPSGGVDQLPPEPCASTVEAVRQSTFPTYSVTSSPALPKIRRQRTPTRRASRARIASPQQPAPHSTGTKSKEQQETERLSPPRRSFQAPHRSRRIGEPWFGLRRYTANRGTSLKIDINDRAASFPKRRSPSARSVKRCRDGHLGPMTRRVRHTASLPPSPTWSPLTLLKPPRPGPRALRDAPATLDKPEP